MAQWEATRRRQTRLPVEAIEKTLEVLIIERQRLHEGSQVASRSKQIDGRSCIGNANLLKLGGLPARPLKENTVGYFASESHLPEAGERAVTLL